MVGVQWSQSGHASWHHEVTNEGLAGHHGPPNAIGAKTFLKKRGASERGRQKCSSLALVFENREKGR